MLTALARRTGNVAHGVDHSRATITEAQRKSLSLQGTFFDVMKAEKLNFTDNFFHLVYSVRTLHETEARKSLGEMYRILVPGGVLIIVDLTKEAAASWSERYFDSEELRKDFYVLIARK